MAYSQYEIPPYGTTAPQLLGWLLEANQQGNAWLSSQRASTNWASLAELMEDQSGPGDESSMMSQTTYPKPKRIARELVASLAGFRHEGEFKVLWDNAKYDKAHVLTDLDRNWYTSTNANAAHRQALQSGVIKGTGYLYEEWDPFYWGPQRGEIKLSFFDPADVTFLQMPRDNDIQRAYMVILRYELPINLARRMYARYPTFAANLVPDQESPSWLLKGLKAVQQFVSPALRVAGRTRPSAQGSYPTVNVYHAYTMDTAANESMEPMMMGVPGANWSYRVPALGSEINTGLPNPATGEQWTRPANREDALMFPLRRFTIWSNTGVATDGSSPWWHGEVPLARIRFNDLPWNALGGSLIQDIVSINGGVEALIRNIEDSAAARLNPPAIFDDGLVSKSWAEAFNPRLAGVRGAAPLGAGDPIKFPVPPEHYDVPQWILQFIESQEGREDYITAVRDVSAIAKAKQIPGADTLEKLLEMAGPIVQDLVRQLEEPFRQLGEWRKAYYFQFYNAARVIQTVGPDEFDPDEWNYSSDIPEDQIPTHVQDRKRMLGPDRFAQFAQSGSYQFDPSQLGGMAAGGTPQENRDALKRSITEFRYEVTESGLNEIHRMTTKLFYIQLMKEGFPISWWTMAKVAKIPNFGPPPQGTNTEMERWIAQQHLKIDLQADLQQEMMQSQVGQMGGGQVGAPGAGGGQNGEVPPIQNLFGGSRSGRGQSYQRPPRMVSKDHGARSTITTAK